MNCKVCKKDFDVKESVRVFGTVPSDSGCCSAVCYTQVVMAAATRKPKCKLIGTDGNVFCIIGRVSAALKAAGQRDRAKEFTSKAMQQGSYDAVLAMLHDYVEVQ